MLGIRAKQHHCRTLLTSLQILPWRASDNSYRHLTGIGLHYRWFFKIQPSDPCQLLPPQGMDPFGKGRDRVTTELFFSDDPALSGVGFLLSPAPHDIQGLAYVTFSQKKSCHYHPLTTGKQLWLWFFSTTRGHCGISSPWYNWKSLSKLAWEELPGQDQAILLPAFLPNPPHTL